MTTATELWQARQISNLRKDQIMRNELDLARLEVEKMAAEIAELTAERDRARDLAVRAGAFEGCPDCGEREIERQHLIDERDQALHERDSLLYRSARGAVLSPEVREAVEFSRGLIPTRPR